MVEMSDKMDQLTDMYYEYSHNAFLIYRLDVKRLSHCDSSFSLSL